MKERLHTIIKMLRDEKHTEVNAGLNRVKGLIDENVLGDFQDEVSKTLNDVRRYDSTRKDMIKVLEKVVESLDE